MAVLEREEGGRGEVCLREVQGGEGRRVRGTEALLGQEREIRRHGLITRPRQR